MNETPTYTTTRTTYRSILNLALAMRDLAYFHADPWTDGEIGHAGAIEAAAAEIGMGEDEARAIVAAYDQSRKGGRPPKQVLEARAVLRGEVYVDPRKGKSMAAVHAAAGNYEKANDALMPIPGGCPDALAARLDAIIESAQALAVAEGRYAAMVEVRPAVVPLLDGLSERAASIYAELQEVWPEAVAAWDSNGYLSGEDAAERNNDGTHWTKSNKGNATTVRYDSTAELRDPNKRHAASLPPDAELDEDAIREMLEDWDGTIE